MLRATVQGSVSPEDRAFAAFWNEVHSVDAVLSDVWLALWLSQPLPQQASSKPASGALPKPGCVIGWQGARRLRWLSLEQAALSKSLFERVRYVALADPRLETQAPQLWTRLESAGYRRELPGQQTGWVRLEDDARAPEKPRGRPNCALLPSRDGTEHLILVEVSYVWNVLSVAGAATYEHGAALLDGDAVHFLETRAAAERCRLMLSRTVDPAELPAQFGDAVSPWERDLTGFPRARSDSPALVVSASSEAS